jgi:dienelactone hydrolase
MTITEHTVKTDRHTSFYLAAGPENGPLIIFIHGWPELSISWRHQLSALAALGFRAIAPDMRGYGRSTVYNKKGEYAQEHIVRDMLDAVANLCVPWFSGWRPVSRRSGLVRAESGRASAAPFVGCSRCALRSPIF